MLSAEDKGKWVRAMSERQAKEIFEDYEAKSNLVGLFDLLLKIDRRVNPQLYSSGDKNHD